MWRPKEGWVNPFSSVTYKLPNKETKEYAFEVGADAMLEALRKMGTHIEEDKYYCSPCGGCNSDEDCEAYAIGSLVCIPDEEGIWTATKRKGS